VLFVVRHGQTDANERGLLLGRADPSLSGVGRRQAAALAAHLPRDAEVIASPLRRTIETAAALGLPVEVDERWIEVDYGVLDGTKVSDVSAETWAAWRADPTFAPSGGESLASVAERVHRACDDLVERARHRNVVVVTHVSPIKAALAWALGSDESLAWRVFVDIASIARIGIEDRGPVLRSLNERAG
jgi:broad specificity phosphatase PhoE